MDSLVKNIKKLQEFLNEFSRKPEILFALAKLEQMTKIYIRLLCQDILFIATILLLKPVESASMLLTLSIVKKLQICV